MLVKLLNHTPLYVPVMAARTCWQSFHLSDTVNGIVGPIDKAFLDKLANKNKHSSIIEHLVYNFDIKGFSRAVLQELARHRIASPTVKSTRYTLKELKEEKPFSTSTAKDGRASKYLVWTGDEDVDNCSIEALENLRRLVKAGKSNDVTKYAMPESYKVDAYWTINARSLQNFLTLRSSNAALWEIRDMANNIYDALPEEHKYLFESCMSKKIC